MINQLCDINDTVGHGEHKHLCPRCNTCWKHDGEATQVSDEAFDEGHSCPECGEENVTKKFMDEQQLRKSLDDLFDRLKEYTK